MVQTQIFGTPVSLDDLLVATPNIAKLQDVLTQICEALAQQEAAIGNMKIDVVNIGSRLTSQENIAVNMKQSCDVINEKASQRNVEIDGAFGKIEAELARLDDVKVEKSEMQERRHHLDVELGKIKDEVALHARTLEAQLEEHRREAKKRQLAEEERAAGMEREMKRQKKEATDRAAEQAAELEKQKKAAADRAAEVEKAMEAQKKAAADRAARVDAELSKKSGKEFLAAQVANLSETAKKAHKDIEVALKEDIQFEPSSAEVTKAGMKIVKKVSEVLMKHPTLKIRVEGHTGCKCIAAGTSPKKGGGCRAVALSESRAASVMTALKNLGCTNQLQSTGHGCIFRVGMAVKVFPAAGQ